MYIIQFCRQLVVRPVSYLVLTLLVNSMPALAHCQMLQAPEQQILKPAPLSVGTQDAIPKNGCVDPQVLYDSIHEKYYALVPFEADPTLFSEAIDAFFAFLEQPDEIKDFMHFKIAPQHRRGELGLTHREPTEDGYGDKKDFFHYHPRLLEKYSQFAAENPVVGRFMTAADKIWQLGAETTKNVLLSLETYSPGICGKVFDTDEPHLVLRLLRYQFDQTQELLAKPHFDAGSFTLAMAESSPGLRIGSGPNDLKSVSHHPGQAIFFLSVNAQQLMAREELLPGWHDVAMLSKDDIGQTYTRWAIVMFIEGHSMTSTSRNETHRWQPDGNEQYIPDRA